MAARKQKLQCSVFLSHSTQDVWISELIKEKIEETGVVVWLDAFDIPGGRNVKERIREGLRECTECLILLSPASRESDWVRHEAGMADGFDIPTTLVLLHVSKEHIPAPLRDLKFFTINEFAGYIKHLSRLVRTRRKQE